jgi:hypothetical protein
MALNFRRHNSNSEAPHLTCQLFGHLLAPASIEILESRYFWHRRLLSHQCYRVAHEPLQGSGRLVNAAYKSGSHEILTLTQKMQMDRCGKNFIIAIRTHLTLQSTMQPRDGIPNPLCNICLGSLHTTADADVVEIRQNCSDCHDRPKSLLK